MKGKRKRGEEAEIPFEEAMGGLEGIVRELESSEIPLERSLELFEEGVRLSRVCQRKLNEAEKKVQLLLKGEDGEFELAPFEDLPPETGGGGEKDDGAGGDAPKLF
jgi:exodeoxyribonuclease VII small subunit